MKRFLLFILAVCCSTVFCVAEEEVCIRVGEFSYTADEIRLTIDKQLASFEYYGTEVTEELYDEVSEQALEDYIIRGITENQIKKEGLDRIDEDTEYVLRERAQADYETAWQNFRQQADTSYSDETITKALDDMGISILSIYGDYLLGYETGLLLERYGVSAELTDDEVAAFYEENYIAPMREAYDGNIPAYETDVYENGMPALYLPDGYRNIRQILIPVPEEISAEILAIEERALALNDECTKLYTEIADKAIAGEEVEELRTLYAEKMAEIDSLEVEHGDAWAKVLPSVREKTDEIYARLKTGESFDTIAADFGGESEDILFHPDSLMWPDVITEALLTMENVGDVSQPALYDDGVHIFYYESNCEGGTTSLSAAEEEIIRSTAQQIRDSEEIKKLADTWRSDYEITVNKDLLAD